VNQYKLAASCLFITGLLLASSGAWATCGGSNPAPGSTVTPTGSGSFNYSYTVFGDVSSCVGFYGSSNFYVNQFEVPYFPDAGVTTITSPAGWSYRILPTDTFSLGHGAETLVWTSTLGPGIAPSAGFTPASSLSGFGYTDSYAPVAGPAALRYADGYTDTFDPALPGSNTALADGLQPTSYPVSPVPEPSSWALFAAGFMLIGFIRTRQREDGAK